MHRDKEKTNKIKQCHGGVSGKDDWMHIKKTKESRGHTHKHAHTHTHTQAHRKTHRHGKDTHTHICTHRNGVHSTHEKWHAHTHHFVECMIKCKVV